MRNVFFIFAFLFLFFTFSCSMISSQDETEGEISATVLAPEGEGDISYTLLDETETTLCRRFGDIKTVRVEFIKDRGNVTAVDTNLGGTVSSEKIHEGHYGVWAGAYDKAGTLVAQSESQEFVNLKGGNAESKTLQLVWSAESAGSLLAVRFFDLTSNSLIGETSVSKGERLSKSNIPHKNGFLFSDWYKDSSLTQAFFDGSEDSLESILYSITLWGKAEIEEVAQTYTVSFESNGGSAVSAQTVSDGDFAKKPADPEKDGKAFSGWFTSLDGGETLSQTEFDFSTPITSDITLYAKWSETVLYVSENGSDENSGFSELEAVKTLSKAALLVDEYSKIFGEDAAWKIYIIGNIAECAKIESTKAKSIALQGKTGANTDSLDGEKNGTTLSINTAVPITIKNLKITNGKASGNGGGIKITDSTVTLGSGVVISGNESAQNGGGVWNSKSSLTIDGAEISTNTANQNGGGIYNCSDATLVLVSGTVSENTAKEHGGGVYNANAFTMDSGAITRNEATKYGGGVYNAQEFLMSGGTIRENKASEGAGVNTAGGANGTFSMSGGSISNNTATEKGGGVCVYSGAFTMSESAVVGNNANETATADACSNKASRGGGIYVASSGTLTLSETLIGGVNGNYATDRGGGIYSEQSSTVIVENGNISFNGTAACGGGINGDGSVTVSGGTIQGNSGRGIYSSTGEIELSGSALISENKGGIYIGGSAQLSIGGSAQITKNTASAGAGVQSNGTFKMTGGTISENTTSGNGGGVHVKSGTFSMSGGTISGNKATSGGGGVYNEGTLFMYGSAVIGDGSKTETATSSAYSNTAAKGGGIYSTGKIYLGYSDENTKSALTGGVCYNYSGDTGGIAQEGGESFMNSGNISYNDGRGLYLYNCTFTMNGGKIRKNTSSGIGGGVYAGWKGAFKMNGGEISDNSSGTDGGGVSIGNTDSSFTMTGGTISGNTATGNGSGVYFRNDSIGPFTMSGSASVASNNDVYLENGKTITVGGAFDTSAPVATITPSSYTAGTQVLDGSAVASEHEKFAVKESGWKIDNAGKLQKSVSSGITITVPEYSNKNINLTKSGETADSITFTVDEGYTLYSWTVGSDVQSSTTNTLTISKSLVSTAGVWIMAIASDGTNYYDAKTFVHAQ